MNEDELYSLYAHELWSAILEFCAIVTPQTQYLAWEALGDEQRAVLTDMLRSVIATAADPSPHVVAFFRGVDTRHRAITGSCAWMLWRLHQGLQCVADDGDLAVLCAEAEYSGLRIFWQLATGSVDGAAHWNDLTDAQRMALIRHAAHLMSAERNPYGRSMVHDAGSEQDRLMTAAIVAHGSLLWRTVHRLAEHEARHRGRGWQ